MIKGQPIDQLFIIRDTTKGAGYLLVMVMMCIAIYALMQVIYAYCIKVKIKSLRRCEYVLTKYHNAIHANNTYIAKPIGKTTVNGRQVKEKVKRNPATSERQREQEEQDEEELEILRILKSR